MCVDVSMKNSLSLFYDILSGLVDAKNTGQEHWLLMNTLKISWHIREQSIFTSSYSLNYNKFILDKWQSLSGHD